MLTWIELQEKPFGIFFSELLVERTAFCVQVYKAQFFCIGNFFHQWRIRFMCSDGIACGIEPAA